MNLNKTVSLKITRHNKFPQKTFYFIGQDQNSKILNRNFAQYNYYSFKNKNYLKVHFNGKCMRTHAYQVNHLNLP